MIQTKSDSLEMQIQNKKLNASTIIEPEYLKQFVDLRITRE